MRRTLMIAVGAAVALATAAVAIAVTTAAGVTTTTATFDAAKVNSKTRSCTGADTKAYEITNGRYVGSVNFTNPSTDLDGPLTIRARTVFSTTDTRGYVAGSFGVKDEDSRASGRIWGTLSGDKFVGFLQGWSWGHHALVLGNVSATFVPATGFTDGAVGSTSSHDVLAVIAGPVCKGPKPEPASGAKHDDKADHKSGHKTGHKPDRPSRPVRVKGEVTAVGDGSDGSTITVKWAGPATVTCKRDATSPATAGFAIGTKVEMKCEKVGDDWVLRELKTHT
jgi:hypothetical protein